MLNEEEKQVLNGGGIGGAILGALDGAAVGLVVALVGAFTSESWSAENTKDCVLGGLVTGACIGFTAPTL